MGHTRHNVIIIWRLKCVTDFMAAAVFDTAAVLHGAVGHDCLLRRHTSLGARRAQPAQTYAERRLVKFKGVYITSPGICYAMEQDQLHASMTASSCLAQMRLQSQPCKKCTSCRKTASATISHWSG